MKLVTHRIPGLALTDHVFSAPLDAAQPDGERIEIFAREVVAADKVDASLPWLVFFQGGPGFGAPRPDGNGGWLKRATRDYRVLLLDQRGTGRSTPATFQTLARFGSPEAVAAYLKHFRADNIVRDAELIRRELVGESEVWSALGQSYGGFVITHYLSVAPASLREVFITGGLPSIERSPDEVYRLTYARVREKNARYFERYPDDVERAAKIVSHIAIDRSRLPNGDALSVRRFQQLGLDFGTSDGFESIHYLLESAFVNDGRGDVLSFGFLSDVQNAQAFDTNPIFAILHESIYCQSVASRWSAERVRAEFPEFQIADGRPVMFTGEMIYPWMFDEYLGLRPLREVAHILANDDAWPRLYDAGVLRANRVPVAAALYYDDMYVPRELSQETAETIRGLKLWVTNEYEHNGLRADGERVLSRLIAMLRGEV